MSIVEQIDWQKMNNLVPAIIQDANSGDVLMLGYMNREALKQTLATNKVTFYSRSKQRLWVKGETSGNTLELVNVFQDCDQDALLIQVTPTGPTCHLGETSCFGKNSFSLFGFLYYLEQLIKQRQSIGEADSYTASLFSSGVRRIAQKVGEEGVEVALAAVAQQPSELIAEATDLLYHLMVLLIAKGLSLEDICQLAIQRHQQKQRPKHAATT